MRLVLALLLAIGPIAGAEETREQVVARLFERGPADEVDFELELGEPKWGRIAVALTIPVDQLRFVTKDDQVARFSILVVDGPRIVHVVDEGGRISAPRGTVPRGEVTRRFEIAAERRTSIVVFDENAQRAGTRVVAFDGKTARVEPVDDDAAANAAWRDVLARANAEKKPVLIFFRTRPCARCRELERSTVPHPATLRRMPAVAFAVLPAAAGEASAAWGSREPGVALFDRTGTLRVRWRLVPDTADFSAILDAADAVADDLERIVQLLEANASHEADLVLGNALARLGRVTDARAALARVHASDRRDLQQAATVGIARLYLREGKTAQATAELERVVADAATPELAADAQRTLAALRAGAPRDARTIRILPLERQLVSGRHVVRTRIASAAVARVAFSLDGRAVARAERPPFSATLDFGDVPERRTIRAVAFDRRGKELAHDELVVNEAGETFWLRLLSPRESYAGGAVRVSMSVRTPAARRVTRVVVSWNGANRAVLTAPPWDAMVDVPEGKVGFLRAVAELDDGRTSEDAVLLNAGFVGEANVQLVELPITLASAAEPPLALTPERIRIREGSIVRRVESVATAAETPLAVGILIDVSASMQKTLPDVQEAAIRFLEAALAPRDRAFVVTFNTEARLLEAVTSDVALLRRRIMATRPDGLTALHDALAIGLLQFQGIKGRRAMIVFSDGVDRTSGYGAAEVSELARRTNVPIHVIAVKAWSPVTGAASAAISPGAWIDDPPNEELRGVALATGGTFHILNELHELPGVYETVEAALRSQVLAVIRTEPATRENDWRSIRVEVEGAQVYAPAGYYATW